jgi:hypothetical protein
MHHADQTHTGKVNYVLEHYICYRHAGQEKCALTGFIGKSLDKF